MAKFNLGINGTEQGAAEAREAWSGEFPPTGTYDGVVKIMALDKIGPEAKNAGKDKVKIGVELRSKTPEQDKKYDGYIAWGNLSLIESAIPYINQFLLALTDGSDAAFDKVKKAFYDAGPTVDERKKHILKIGAYTIDSPEGELPIKVSLVNKPYYNEKTKQTIDSVSISSYLAGGGSTPKGAVSAGPETSTVEEEGTVDLDPEDENGVEPEEDSQPSGDSEPDVSADDESLLDA